MKLLTNAQLQKIKDDSYLIGLKNCHDNMVDIYSKLLKDYKFHDHIDTATLFADMDMGIIEVTKELLNIFNIKEKVIVNTFKINKTAIQELEEIKNRR